MSQLRFFLDEDVYSAAAAQLRNAGIDSISTLEAGRREQSDVSQLSWAAANGWVLVTFNVSHFAALHTEWLQNGLEHAGIVVSKRILIGRLIRRLTVLAKIVSAVEAVSRLFYLNESL
jgi:hypothetical protein